MLTVKEVVSNILSEDMQTYGLGLKQLKMLDTDALLLLMDAPQSKIRTNSAYTLSKRPSEQVVANLIEKLNDKNAGVCSAIAAALGTIGNQQAKEPMVNFFKNIDKNKEKNGIMQQKAL